MYDFDPNDRETIVKILDGDFPEHPIAIAAGRKVEEFLKRYQMLTFKNKGRPVRKMILVKPITAFDEIVCRKCLQMVADATGDMLTIVWVPGEAEEAGAPVHRLRP